MGRPLRASGHPEPAGPHNAPTVDPPVRPVRLLVHGARDRRGTVLGDRHPHWVPRRARSIGSPCGGLDRGHDLGRAAASSQVRFVKPLILLRHHRGREPRRIRTRRPMTQPDLSPSSLARLSPCSPRRVSARTLPLRDISRGACRYHTLRRGSPTGLFMRSRPDVKGLPASPPPLTHADANRPREGPPPWGTANESSPQRDRCSPRGRCGRHGQAKPTTLAACVRSAGTHQRPFLEASTLVIGVASALLERRPAVPVSVSSREAFRGAAGHVPAGPRRLHR